MKFEAAEMEVMAADLMARFADDMRGLDTLDDDLVYSLYYFDEGDGDVKAARVDSDGYDGVMVYVPANDGYEYRSTDGRISFLWSADLTYFDDTGCDFS